MVFIGTPDYPALSISRHDNKIGIGTVSPRLRLDVNGDMMISNIRAGNGPS